MIDFTALEEAFAPVGDVGRREITFEVEGNTVTLQPLLPRDEIEIQRYASVVLDESSDKQGNVEKHVAMAYYDRFRVEVLAYSIAELNGLDLRDVDYVATGQKTDKGRPVRVAKHVAIRDLITKKVPGRNPWSRVMIETTFAKYGELMERIENESEDLVEYEPSDLVAEIERMEKRLIDLKAEKEKRAKGDANLMAEQVKALQQHDKTQRQANQAVARVPTATKTPEETKKPAFGPEILSPDAISEQLAEAERLASEMAAQNPEPTWAEFEEMPVAADLKESPEGPVVSQRTEPREPVIPPRSEPPVGGPPMPPSDPLGDIQDSFQDADEEGVLEAEAQRILAARQAFARERAAQQKGETPPSRTPPHLRGARPDPRDLEAKSLDAVPVGNIGDAPAFRLPTQDLSSRGKGVKNPSVVTDQVSDGTKARNPNFRPPKR